MTESKPNNHAGGLGELSTTEMLELAGVDALGLLDEEERVAFDRAFDRAPGAVRELVRAEQARVAELGLALPDVVIPEGLRGEVLSRVREEIERSKAASPVSAAPARTASHSGGARPEPRSLGIRRARRVNPAWRIAAIGASVATVVLASLQVRLRQDIQNLSSRMQAGALTEAVGLDELGILFPGPDAQRVALIPTGDVGHARAHLVFEPDHGWRLMAMNLSSRVDYSVVAMDESGSIIETIADFQSNDVLTLLDLPISAQRGETIHVAIVRNGEEREQLFAATFTLAGLDVISGPVMFA